MAQVITAYQRNLQKLGIQSTLRQSDFAVLQKRLDAFDFDVTTLRYPEVDIPGSEQFARFSSRAADEPGSDNLAGIKSPAIDAILRALTGVQTREQLIAATHSLDRVLLHGYYVIPQWYSSSHRVAYKRALAFPSTLPLYYQPENWVISTWWRKADNTLGTGTAAASASALTSTSTQ
jgi:microcin C transport system substrate-binding protein